MNEKNHILIIEDEIKTANFITMALKAQGYKVTSAQSGKGGILSFCTANPDVILLNLGLPDMDGMEVIEEIRKVSEIPIGVISSRCTESDIVTALDAGANDYITKPFSMGELLARVRVMERFIRREFTAKSATVYRFPDLTVDTEKRRVTLFDKEIHFTPMEYKLLVLLVSNAGKVIGHRQIAKEVWGYSETGGTQSIRVCAASLRRKLEPDTANPRYIFTEVGIGYRFTDYLQNK